MSDNPETTAAEGSDRYNVPALERGLRLLACFSPAAPAWGAPDLARQLQLPVCIHDRDAHGDTLAILKTEGRGIRGVLHCYSGSMETARELLKLGWYLGIDGPLTFKNAAKLPEIVRALPADRILVETDCPYMTPAPFRGKRNEPAFVKYIAQRAAEIRAESPEEFSIKTRQNARDLYGI